MLVASVLFFLGVCVGSFTNVLIFRLPRSESVVRPGSHCRVCREPLAWYENVPLLSYLALRGRCGHCGAPFSLQYPLVELAVGLLFAGNFLLLGPGPDASVNAQLRALASPEWLAGAILTTLLLAIALTDLRTYLIPDELSVGGMLMGLSLSYLPGGLRPLDAFLGAVVGAAVLLLVAWLGSAVFKKEAMGGGDIKMLAMIGAFVEWEGVLLTLFLGALLGSILYGPIILYRRLRPAVAVRIPAGSGGPAPAAVARRSAVAANGSRPGWEASGGPREGSGTGNETSGVPEEGSGSPEDVDRGLVPFGFFLAPAAALTFYLREALVQGYLRMVGLAD